MNKMGSGVMEKTIETLINRRMKKRGMSWSPAGARVSLANAASFSSAPTYDRRATRPGAGGGGRVAYLLWRWGRR